MPKHRSRSLPLAVGFVAVFLLEGLAAQAGAQVITASILGIAKDETGAVLPGVTVTITNTDTGISRTLTTDEHGRYVATQLALGDAYQVQGELQGFQVFVRRGIALTLGREAVVDLTMKVGDVAEQIVVQGEVSLIQSTNAVVSGRVDERQMHDLPLNARSYIDLSLLQAGTIQARTATGTSFGDTGTALTVAGARPTATTFLLDGTTTTSVRGKAPASVAGTALGVDSIREFEVITSPYSAEYGRGTGGTISVVSKAGSNRFQGSAFEFLRNSAMDARNFFDPLEGPPEFKRNQFGGSLGGPIARNRTFFFGNYEGLRQQLGSTNIFRVPTDATRRGVIGGQTVPIKPDVLPYLALYPQPNGRDFGDGTAEFSEAFSRNTDEDYFTARVDHQFTDNQSLFVRYTYSNARDLLPGNLLMFLETGASRSQFMTAEYKTILSAHALNVARVGFTRHNLLDSEAAGVDISPSLSIQPGAPMPRLAVTGLSELGSSDLLPQAFLDNTLEMYDSITYTRGAHTMKAGGQIQFLQNNVESNTRQASRWNFNSLTNFLLGRANRMQIAPRDIADPIRNLRQKFGSLFFQDDIRLSPRLTANVGLRAEFAGTITETEGRLASMPLDKFQSGTFDDIQQADPWYNNPGTTWGPRVGLAWDVFGDATTALRGGFGIFYDHTWSWWMSGTGAYRMGPYYNTFDLRETFNFPMSSAEILALLQQRQQRVVPFGNQVYEPTPDPEKQQVQQYGLDLQRQLRGNLVVKVGYKGSHGRNLPRIADLNTATPLAVDENGPIFSLTPTAPNTQFGTMLVITTDSMSSYNALLLEVSRRLNRGLSFQTAYTLAKAIDEGSGVRTSGDAIAGAGGGTVMSYEFREIDRSLSTFDVRHTLVTNVGFELPFGEGRKVSMSGVSNAILGGWDLNTIIMLASGNPATVGMGTTATTILLGGSRRPDLVPGGNNNPVLGGPDHYFDASQFVSPSAARLGDVGRNTVIGPGYANVDFSLVKNFALHLISDRARVSFRGEIFNALNRANFSLPDMQVFNGTGQPLGSAGRITATSGTARQIQLGLRMDW